MRIISGYAVKWGSWSSPIVEDGKEFSEQFERGSFKESLEGKYQIACYKHDLLKEIASVGNENLVLKEDSVGLNYTIYLPGNQLGKQICSEIDNGLLSHVSVGFKDFECEWITFAGKEFRSIKRANLYEISLVKTPAYMDTTIVDRGATNSTMIATKIDNILIEQERKDILKKNEKALAR